MGRNSAALLASWLLAGCAATALVDPGDAAGADGAGPDGGLPADAGSDGGIPDAGNPDGGARDGSADAGLPGDAETGPTQMLSQVTDHGVTWTFTAAVPVGRFVTGEPYVVGAATVTAIDPSPAGGRNGSVRNIPPDQGRSGFDDRIVQGRYDPSLALAPRIALAPGDSLASSISAAQAGLVENWLREGNGETSESPVQSVSILTCLSQAVPADTFRPSYAGHPDRLYRLSEVRRDLLPQLAPPSPVDTATLQTFATRLQRPWVDNLFYAFDAQVEYMAMYGREMGRVAGIASLLLMLDLPADQKPLQDQLLVGFVQHGIDLWGLVQAGYPGWYAHGGHGSGRKWFIALSGALLGDSQMAAPSRTYPGVQFGEDMHTSFPIAGLCPQAWSGATVVYTGHMGIWNGAVVSSTPGWGPYEHLSPADWIYDGGEGYRRCCTSIAWVGQALAARLMNAQADWGHDAFFAYVDRWMTAAGDATYTQRIFDLKGWDYRADWQAQGQAWDSFVDEMWARYR